MAKRGKQAANVPAIIIAVVVGLFFAAMIFDTGDAGTSEATGGTEVLPAEGSSGAEGAGDPGGQGAAASGGAARPFSGPGYILDFTDDFNPGLAGIDDLGISVVLAIDTSGSMADPPATGGREKYLQASAALTSIVDYLERFAAGSGKDLLLKVCLIRFDDDVDTPFGLTAMDSAAFDRLRAVVSDPDTFEPGGKTTLGLAIEWAAEILAQSGTIFKSVIVLSDGENTLGPDPADVLFGINENRVDASTVDVPLSTRGTLVSFVGFDIDSAAFADLQDLGARVTTADNQEELEQALTSLLVADITRLESAQ